MFGTVEEQDLRQMPYSHPSFWRENQLTFVKQIRVFNFVELEISLSLS